ncbi:universal stress protein [Mesorhizobium sp. KR9-304]|uniref:universal stress protein n=1 Tax=Mesorhizobium sp. KR9-304 TaxID=3156614 RepID=UPI0032B57A01
MKLQTFLPLVTYPDASSDAAIANAAAVSRLLSAELNVLALEVDIPEVSNALSRMLLDLPTMIREAEKLSAQQGSRLLALAKTKADGAAIVARTGAVACQLHLLGETAADHARYSDLALVGLEAENPGTRMVAEAVIFGSGRPTMLMPAGKPVEKLDRIAIAWDGSRVAARAVADARHMLERASAVSVITVTDEKPLKDQDAGKRLAASLRQGGLKAEFSAILAEDCPIAETLQQHAIGTGADLLVMGGYGHSRLRDFVLGGATEGVLTDLRLPVLLSH